MPNAIGVRHEPADFHAAAVGAQNSGKNLDRRRLAGAIWSDEAEQLAGLEAERHVGERFDRAAAAVKDSAYRARQARVAFRNGVALG